jgi:hypothetical protein
MVDWWKFGQALKFGTLTLPGEFDAAAPSRTTVSAEGACWRRFREGLKRADPCGRVFGWKREVGSEGGRMHRHPVIVTKLSNKALKRLAWRAGYGRVVNFKRATGGKLSHYLAKYIAKPGVNLAAWPSRTRWAQTIIPARWPDQPRKGGPWLVHRFEPLTPESSVMAWFDVQLGKRGELWRGAPACVCLNECLCGADDAYS